MATLIIFRVDYSLPILKSSISAVPQPPMLKATASSHKIAIKKNFAWLTFMTYASVCLWWRIWETKRPICTFARPVGTLNSTACFNALANFDVPFCIHCIYPILFTKLAFLAMGLLLNCSVSHYSWFLNKTILLGWIRKERKDVEKLFRLSEVHTNFFLCVHGYISVGYRKPTISFLGLFQLQFWKRFQLDR